MFKKNKLQLILSSVIIVLPALFGLIMWQKLPDSMATHWGADGNVDGVSGKAFAVFGLPAILLLAHVFCLLATLLDKKQREQSPKALGILFWIIPAISLFANGILYGAAFGKEFDFALFMPALLGGMFLLLGNYFPKVKQNRTLGIKISWTILNEENWNKTHRLAGKVWVVGGFVMLLTVFLPLAAMVWVTVCMIAAMVLIPVGYSYSIYRQHQKEGIVYAAPERSKSEKIAFRISAVIVSVICIGIAVLMCTGNIAVHCEDTALKIQATYWTDLTVDYSAVDSIAYREDIDVGIRTNGFASAKLSLGTFQNEAFGSYTLYAYTGAKGFVVLTSQENTLVIGMRDPRDAQELYDAIVEKGGIQG